MQGGTLKTGKFHIAVIAAALSIVICSVAFASVAFAITIPERLEYDLTWAGILAGTAVLEVRDTGTDIQFSSRAISSPFVTVFYKVDDTAVSSLRKAPHKTLPGIPYNYRMKLSEGSSRKDKEVIFDLKARQAIYIDHLENERLSFEVSESTMDALTCFFHVRYLPLQIGKSVYAQIFDNKKYYRVEVQVLNREEIETPLGKFNTVLIKPILLTEGIFQRKGDVLIWLTDDDKRLPVLLKTKVKVGSIKATLTGGSY
jgi:hypothetical protein